MLSITSDYKTSKGDPEEYLKRISEAGYTHVHWCHHWDTDFIYTGPEIDHLLSLLDKYGLMILDIHGTHGREKRWFSLKEHERQAGVELVRNRIDMASRLSCPVIIVHTPHFRDGDREEVRRDIEAQVEQLVKSLDEIRDYALERNVKIALENMDGDNFEVIDRLLKKYPSDYLGFCYDSGHGNLDRKQGLDHLDGLKERLISLHLHDNDGLGDSHQPLFQGSVDWKRLAEIIALSSYDRCVSMEVSIDSSGFDDEAAFLKDSYDRGMEFDRLINSFR